MVGLMVCIKWAFLKIPGCFFDRAQFRQPWS